MTAPPLFYKSELEKQLKALQQARWAGTLTTTYQANGVNRSVTYKSDREMAAAITDLEQRIAAMAGTGRPMNVTVRSLRGWERPS
jgi:hypothetical protein